MEVGDERDAQLRRFERLDVSIEKRGIGAPHDAGSEVDQVGCVIHDDCGGWS
jgi:hypothetical protein